MTAMRMCHAAWLAVLLSAALVAGAQTVQDGTIRVTTRLVEVSVVVQDKNGPVAGLTKGDFTVLDNGKAQRIDVFSSSDVRSLKQPRLGNVPRGVVSNLMTAAGEVPDRATVILFDMMNSSNDGQNRDATAGDPAKPPVAVRGIAQPTANIGVMGNTTNDLTAIKDKNDAIKQLVSYLKTIREGDRVALFVLDHRLRVIQDFTGDSNVLFRAAERLKALDLAGVEVTSQAQLFSLLEPPADPFTGGFIGTPTFADGMAITSAINRATATADAFEAIARHMSGLPGRKNLVWMSAGFPFKPVVSQRILGVQAQAPVETPDDFSSQLTRASKALNDAGVAIYPVDYQGLNGSYPEVMMRLAYATGGSVSYHTNDLSGAVSTAVADADVSYTLGFYSTDEKYDGRLHDLKVKVDRKDVDLRYRSGYYSARKTISEKQRKEIVGQLLASEVNASQIGLAVSGDRDPAIPGSYKVTISVDAANLDLTQNGDRRTGQLSLTMRLEASKSNNAQAGAVPLNFSEEQFRNVLNRGFVIRQTVEARPGDRLRIIVQDQSTGLAGSVWLPLQ